jgi:hypothetical protein
MRVIERGTYRAKGQRAVLGRNANDKDYVGVEFVVTGAEHNGEVISERWYMATDDNARITMQRLMVAGWAGDLMDLSSFGAVEVDLVVDFKVSPNGKEYPTIKAISPAGMGGRSQEEELSVPERKAIAARWSHVAKNLTKLRVVKPTAEKVPF